MTNTVKHSTGDIVIFTPRDGETAEGIITRVWDKPASDPYVTIETDGPIIAGIMVPRTFVRCSSAVRGISSLVARKHDHHESQPCGVTCPSHPRNNIKADA